MKPVDEGQDYDEEDSPELVNHMRRKSVAGTTQVNYTWQCASFIGYLRRIVRTCALNSKGAT